MPTATDGQFLSPFDMRDTGEMRKGRLIVELLQPLAFACTIDGEERYTEAPKGYLSDLASTGRVFRGFVPQFGRYSAAAVIHDILYHQMIGNRVDADAIFLEAMRVSNVRWLTRSTMYRLVRLLGQEGWGKAPGE